jgi:hypothetical protein
MKTVTLLIVLVLASLGNRAGAGEPSSNTAWNGTQVESDMEQQVYTHACWRVKPGNEAAFIEAWSALSDVFASLDRPPIWGTLLRSATEPNVFYSFGPWHSAADVALMRNSEVAQKALAALSQLCEEATPGMYHVVKHVEVGDH